MALKDPLPSPTITRFNQFVIPTYARFPVTIARGEGTKVWDDRGKEYLDFVAGIATCSLGHAPKELIETATKQLKKVHHVSNYFYTEEMGLLLERLAQLSCCERSFICNSGAEANEGAIKLARKYARLKLGITDPVIITANQSFHGRTIATVTATGQPKYQHWFTPLVPGFAYVDFNDTAGLRNLVAEIQSRGAGQAGSKAGLAAIMLEPIQGEGGVRPGTEEFFTCARELADRTGALLILDEVQSGNARCGTFWAHQRLGIEPDILTTAKGMGGGIPIGAFLTKEHCSVMEPGDHGTTFGGNPFSCACALAVLETISKPEFIASVNERGEELQALLKKTVASFPELFASVRGWGLMVGLQLQEGVSVYDIIQGGIEEGLLVISAGPSVIRFVPPLNVSRAEIIQAVSIVENICRKLAASK